MKANEVVQLASEGERQENRRFKMFLALEVITTKYCQIMVFFGLRSLVDLNF